jgi:hypothetical protein
MRNPHRIIHQRPMTRANIPGADQSAVARRATLLILFDIENGGRSAEDMPGINEFQVHAWCNLGSRVVANRLTLLQTLLHILDAVDRFWQWATPFPGGLALFGPATILSLNVGAVGEQHLQQIDGGGRAVDGPLKPLGTKTREQTAVVDMRMGQDNEIDLRWLEWQWLEIALIGIMPTLKHPAIDQKLSRHVPDRDRDPEA